jgi:hypothetical protein
VGKILSIRSRMADFGAVSREFVHTKKLWQPNIKKLF